MTENPKPTPPITFRLHVNYIRDNNEAWFREYNYFGRMHYKPITDLELIGILNKKYSICQKIEKNKNVVG